MTIVVITDQIGVGPLVELDLTGAGESVMVREGVLVASLTANAAIYGTLPNQAVTVMGDVWCNGAQGIFLGGSDAIVLIAAGGRVASPGLFTSNAVIEMRGDFAAFSNEGDVSGTVTFGGSNNTINNSGAIVAGLPGGWLPTMGLYLGKELALGTSINRVTNSGLISGLDYSILSGQLSPPGFEWDSTDVVRNSGTLQGTVALGDLDDRLLNSGAVNGDVWMGAGNDLLVVYGSGRVNGTVDMGTGDNVARISGVVDGDILFSGGTASLHLRGNGLVTGWIYGDFANDTLTGGRDEDQMESGGGNDLLAGRGGDDQLYAGGGDDTVTGGDGDDRIEGSDGRDDLAGGLGDDVLIGGAFADRLAGEGGADLLTGGGGADLFLFGVRAGDDIVTDFQNGLDRIDLTALGRVDFASLSTAIASAGATEVRIDLSRIGGTGSILLQGVTLAQIDASDFLL
jgi:Ca2+-binding RTX toxin-like protein